MKLTDYEDNIKKFKSYSSGAVFGMLCEYLYRVERTPIVIILALIYGVLIFIDIIYKPAIIKNTCTCPTEACKQVCDKCN